MKPVRELLDEWEVKYGIRLEYFQSYRHWTRRYHGSGSAIRPFDDRQPRLSWEICPSKEHPQSFEGRIWKCAPLAYLKLQAERHHLSEKWTPYLQHQPLRPDCTPDEAQRLFCQTGRTLLRHVSEQAGSVRVAFAVSCSAHHASRRLAA